MEIVSSAEVIVIVRVWKEAFAPVIINVRRIGVVKTIMIACWMVKQVYVLIFSVVQIRIWPSRYKSSTEPGADQKA